MFDAFAQNLAAARPKLVRWFAARQLHEEAEDLAGDVLLAAVRYRSSYDPSRPLLPWLLKIAAHHRAQFWANKYPAGTTSTLCPDDGAPTIGHNGGPPLDPETATTQRQALPEPVLYSMRDPRGDLDATGEDDGAAGDENACLPDAPHALARNRLLAALRPEERAVLALRERGLSDSAVVAALGLSRRRVAECRAALATKYQVVIGELELHQREL